MDSIKAVLEKKIVEEVKVNVDGSLEIITDCGKVSMFARRIMSDKDQNYEKAHDYLVIEVEDNEGFADRTIIKSGPWKDYDVKMVESE